MEKIWFNAYPKGVSHEIDTSTYSSVVELFEESCAKFKDRAAFTNMGSELSFEDLNYMTADFASFLQNVAGLKKGDRVAIQLPNVLQYPVALYGALRAGLVVVNTNPLYTAREMKHQLKDSGAKAIVIFANSAHHLEEIIDETDVETVVVTQVGDLLGFPKSLLVNSVVKYVKKMVPSYKLPKAYSFYQALDLGSEKSFTPVKTSHEDTCFLQYTGGTTGVSKGTDLTHRNIVANLLQVAEWKKPLLKYGEEVAILALPLYHIFSLTVNGLSLLRYGATNVMITNPRDIPGFIKTLRKTRFTVFPGLNTLFNALMHHEDFQKIDFSNLKISVAGGMALQEPVARKWVELTKTPIVEGYGLTETSPVACCNPIDGTDKVGTVGLPLPSTEVATWDEDGKELPQGETGEIVIKGPQVMRGYWNRPEETDKVLVNGWLKTGDIGFCDSQGFFKIVDRKKDMILVSGFNVYPNEIENVLVDHPKILEAAAVGVPDERSTEVVKVFIVAKDKSLTKEEVIKYCKEQLTGYKIPKYVEFRDELPKTNVGKILRRSLRDEEIKK
ncbi:MAG: long-chain-fatty-acid--CoA ligase [Bdellovibrionaceae bacterium]|nr:long-chain-fatty-acid--CoA ligase [Pseudobdellovibrionaceae bacterium]|tara:strand:- start:1430 stop:3100 length:1671 start_codon:yes stop_codon:yes gene_type:complete